MDKVRYFPEHNYLARFDGHTTTRFALEGSEPITKLEWPETYDIAINSKCMGGCSYCYTSAKRNGRNFPDIVPRIHDYFGSMSDNERPFQVALGGAGEPTLHPQFPEVLRAFTELGIVPNFTTNGMHLGQRVLSAVKEFAGGVAVSTHAHLDWKTAVKKLHGVAGTVHLHVIISDRKSIRDMYSLYEEIEEYVDAVVLLPYQATGRAKPKNMALGECLDRLVDQPLPKVAYGAYFYEHLKTRPELNASLYEPHSFSAYLIADEDLILYDSSFTLQEIRRGVRNVGCAVT